MHIKIVKVFVCFICVFNASFIQASLKKELYEIYSTGGNLGAFYYISRYPKYLGGYWIGISLLSDSQKQGDEWWVIPVVSYNLFFEPADVGPEGRSRVFLANAGLMIAGHYAYEWFFKKEIEEPISLQFHPIITKDRYTLAIIKQF